ncbi:(2Fe-2S)-binding protein [Orrella dioscoreae]|uniref:(2Fe-2S)-binding protein n=1 Tax=Orrella dioscoreae TaxID=1851544 RepID=UPI00083753B0|nr:(2Fe-2S)-binding protein [Orrella dioscoreae]
MTRLACASRDPGETLSFTRRDILRGGVAVTGVSVTGIGLSGTSGAAASPQAEARPGQDVPLRLQVNGLPVDVLIDTRSSLLDVLREQLGLTGAKKGCDHGQCGACTVHVDGRRVVACLTLAAKMQGRSVLTIEGLAPEAGTLHPMQQAFIDHDALQCGYCTPGQIMAAVACVREGHASCAADIRESMSGNLCRCGAYAGIVTAIQDAAANMEAT